MPPQTWTEDAAIADGNYADRDYVVEDYWVDTEEEQAGVTQTWIADVEL